MSRWRCGLPLSFIWAMRSGEPLPPSAFSERLPPAVVWKMRQFSNTTEQNHVYSVDIINHARHVCLVKDFSFQWFYGTWWPFCIRRWWNLWPLTENGHRSEVEPEARYGQSCHWSAQKSFCAKFFSCLSPTYLYHLANIGVIKWHRPANDDEKNDAAAPHVVGLHPKLGLKRMFLSTDAFFWLVLSSC